MIAPAKRDPTYVASLFAEIQRRTSAIRAASMLSPSGIEISRHAWDALLAHYGEPPDQKVVGNRLMGLPLGIRDDLGPGEIALRFRTGVRP